jgi:hypothetical protein
MSQYLKFYGFYQLYVEEESWQLFYDKIIKFSALTGVDFLEENNIEMKKFRPYAKDVHYYIAIKESVQIKDNKAIKNVQNDAWNNRLQIIVKKSFPELRQEPRWYSIKIDDSEIISENT